MGQVVGTLSLDNAANSSARAYRVFHKVRLSTDLHQVHPLGGHLRLRPPVSLGFTLRPGPRPLRGSERVAALSSQAMDI